MPLMLLAALLIRLYKRPPERPVWLRAASLELRDDDSQHFKLAPKRDSLQKHATFMADRWRTEVEGGQREAAPSARRASTPTTPPEAATALQASFRGRKGRKHAAFRRELSSPVKRRVDRDDELLWC